jgi:cold-inducible RNA-binding protein
MTSRAISRPKPERMARVYFDSIAVSITREDIREFFTRAGEVRGVLLMTDKVSGESRGFGCVDMATDADALHAISSLQGSSIKGGSIRIEQARVEPAKPGKRPKQHAS